MLGFNKLNSTICKSCLKIPLSECCRCPDNGPGACGMTSAPDGQNQDYRRLLALRTSGATPPPSERFLPLAPAPPPANVQPQKQQPQSSPASAQGAAQCPSAALINSVGDHYMRREAPPLSSSYHYRLPPHVAAAYQAQVSPSAREIYCIVLVEAFLEIFLWVEVDEFYSRDVKNSQLF
jgi:hypothetical protein